MDYKDEKIERYLDELADEYKKLLFAAFIEHTNTFDDLSVSDLLRLDSEIKRPLLSSYAKVDRRKKMFRFVGVIYMAIGTLAYILSDMFTYNNAIPQISLIVILLGLISVIVSLDNSLISFLSPKVHNKKISLENKSLIMYNVVTTWRDIEGIANDLSTKDGLVRAPSVIQLLIDNKFINEDEQKILKELLRLRNDIVHSSKESNSFSGSQMIDLLSEARKIIDKVRKLI